MFICEYKWILMYSLGYLGIILGWISSVFRVSNNVFRFMMLFGCLINLDFSFIRGIYFKMYVNNGKFK